MTPTTEAHLWKLGHGAWAQLTITGKLDSVRLLKLRDYVALLDADDTPPESQGHIEGPEDKP